jgi:hypothetical protein
MVMPILTVSPSSGLSTPYMDSRVYQKAERCLRRGGCLITKSEIHSTPFHVILNEASSGWRDPT